MQVRIYSYIQDVNLTLHFNDVKREHLSVTFTEIITDFYLKSYSVVSLEITEMMVDFAKSIIKTESMR